MSTTSVAVVYAVMLEFGFNATDYGKTVLAACFITDLATVLALGFIFAPFTFKTLIFFASCGVAAIVFPWLTPRFFRRSRRHSNRLLAWIRATLAQETIKTHFHVSVGHPAEQIVRYAEEHAIDHFVVGHRGRTLFERWLIGSVARQLIAHAHCAVTVLR